MIANRRQALKRAGLMLAGTSAGFMVNTAKASGFDADAPLFLVTVKPRLDGETSDTKRLQRALDEAMQHGGGTVYVAPGRYVSGTLILRSNVSLWLDNGVVLAMSPDTAEFLTAEKLSYDPGANQATSDFHVALFAGDKLEHIAIFGEGIIECDRGAKGGGPKPIALRRCNYVKLSGITIRNAQNYNVSLLGCQFVEIEGMTILAGHADGIDPDCCRHLRISNCYIESVDDSLCLKASGSLGEKAVCEYVTVTNCVLRTASIHFKCGTESCGDFRNITISNCVFEGGLGLRHGNPGLAFYTVDEGALENVVVDNITMQDVGTPLAIIRGDRDRCSLHQGAGIVRSVKISNIVATGAKFPSVIAGLPGFPIEGIYLSDISISMNPVPVKNGKGGSIPESPKAYPQPTMFGELPVSGLFMRHVTQIHIRDLHFNTVDGDEKLEVLADDVHELRLLDYEISFLSEQPRLVLRNVQNSFVSCFYTSEHAGKIHLEGEKTRQLYLEGKGAIGWQKSIAIQRDVPAGAVHMRRS